MIKKTLRIERYVVSSHQNTLLMLRISHIFKLLDSYTLIKITIIC